MKLNTAYSFCTFVIGILIAASDCLVHAANPIVPGIGLTDPHGVVFGDRVYLFATHDAFPNSRKFVMTNWWVWSSADLVNWRQEGTLQPEDTFLKRPFNDCWATFGARRNGKYYWYFSAGPTEIGVVLGDTPAGPWKDPLGKPLLAKRFTPTEQRDPDILMDADGQAYIIFGVWKYYIARLNDDMISLAETPRLVVLDQKFGPYGAGKTDDKPSLHQRNGFYYLSWSSFYAMSTNVYGPYTFKGSVITTNGLAPEFRQGNIFHDRHGNFFTWHHQWYYACNDKSQPGRWPPSASIASASANTTPVNRASRPRIILTPSARNSANAPPAVSRFVAWQTGARSIIRTSPMFRLKPRCLYRWLALMAPPVKLKSESGMPMELCSENVG